MISKHAIAEKIIDKYEKNILMLPNKKKVHFFRRAYRVTGNTKYIDIIAPLTQSRTIPSLIRDTVLLENKIEKKINISLNQSFKPENPRQRKRCEMYMKNPEIYFFNNFLANIFHVVSMNLCECLLKDICESALKLFRKVDFDRLYNNDDVIMNVGAFAVNSIYFLSHLNVNIDLKNRFIQKLGDLYFENKMILKKDIDKWDYRTFIYNLTHITIGESFFYQNYVTDQLWITEYFSKNIDEIIEKGTADVISEVGLCIKLTQEEKKYIRAMDKIENYLINNYDYNMKLAPNNLVKAEHTNCIIMLLFYENSKWFCGPDLTTRSEFSDSSHIIIELAKAQKKLKIANNKLRIKRKKLKQSKLWRYTKPLRKLKKLLSRHKFISLI